MKLIQRILIVLTVFMLIGASSGSSTGEAKLKDNPIINVVGNDINLNGVATENMSHQEYLLVKQYYDNNPRSPIYINGELMTWEEFDQYFMDIRYDVFMRDGYYVQEGGEDDDRMPTLKSRVSTLEEQMVEVIDRLDGHDEVLADHEERIGGLEETVYGNEDTVGLVEQVTENTENIAKNTKKINKQGRKLATVEGKITVIEDNVKNGSAKLEAFKTSTEERFEAIESNVTINANDNTRQDTEIDSVQTQATVNSKWNYWQSVSISNNRDKIRMVFDATERNANKNANQDEIISTLLTTTAQNTADISTLQTDLSTLEGEFGTFVDTQAGIDGAQNTSFNNYVSEQDTIDVSQNDRLNSLEAKDFVEWSEIKLTKIKGFLGIKYKVLTTA